MMILVDAKLLNAAQNEVPFIYFMETIAGTRARMAFGRVGTKDTFILFNLLINISI